MSYRTVFSLLVLLAAAPALAASPTPPMPDNSAAEPMPVTERDARMTVVTPPIASDAMQGMPGAQKGKFDAVNQPHRKYTRIEDFWQDR